MKKENIITGLFKNLLRKNITCGREGFKVFDKDFFVVNLDVSGFDSKLIKSALVELLSDPEWIKLTNREELISDIKEVNYNYDEELVNFLILKDNLIELRDSIIKVE